MKYLKLFENYNSDIIWQWLSDLDWKIDGQMYWGVRTHRNTSNSITIIRGRESEEDSHLTLLKSKFTQDETNKLNSTFGVMGLQVITSDYWTLIKDKEDESRPYQSKILILKLEDDWYLVYSFGKPNGYNKVDELSNLAFIMIDYSHYANQYLCDQFDGLCYLLKRLLVSSFTVIRKVSESNDTQDDLQVAEDFLDDTFAELMDIWSIPEGTAEEVADEKKEKAYCFRKDPNRRNVYLIFYFDTAYLAAGKLKIGDFMSDIKEACKKVKVAYRMYSMESGAIAHTSFVPLYRVMIWLNVDGRNDGLF